MLELSWPICYYKMAKKKQGINKTWVIAIVVIIALLFASNQGWFEKFSIVNSGSSWFSGTSTFGGGDSSITSGESYIVLSVSPSEPCLGNLITGSISSNLPSAVCNLQAKIGSLPWMTIGDSFILDQQGKYSASTPVNTVGTATFRVICGNVVSNERIVTVYDCSSSDSPSSSSYTCGITSYCAAGTCPTSYSCQEISSLETTWCACVDILGEVHPDWKPTGENYNPTEIDEEGMSEEEYAATSYCQQTAYNQGYDGGYLIYGGLTCSAYANNVCYPYSAGLTNNLTYGGYTCCMWNCNF